MAALAAVLSSAAPGVASAGPLDMAGFDVTAGARLAVSYDDGPLVGRRGQFLGAVASSEEQRDFAVVPRLDLSLGRRLGWGNSVTAEARIERPVYRTIEDLTALDATLRLTVDEHLGELKLSPGLGLRFHGELPEWSYRIVEPALAASYTFDFGLMAAVSYRFTAQRFARTAGGNAQPRNSYANIDFQGHVAELDLRLWPLQGLRLRLVTDVHSTWYGNNTSTTLADYVDLSPGSPRMDRGGGATVEVLVAPFAALLVSAGARREIAGSNSDAFRFDALHGLGTAFLTLGGRHSLYAAVDYGRYDFPDARFDRRYDNTRQDFRREVRLAYTFELSETARAQVSFRRDDAVSNDCADFDPERDANGLPVYSKSYSCYGRTRAEAFFEVEI